MGPRTFVMAALSFLLVVVPAWGLDTKPKQIIAMEAQIAELDTHYGLTGGKYDTFGITLDKLRAKYARLIIDAQTLEEAMGFEAPQTRSILPPDEFRQLMIAMVAELRDGHANTSKNQHDVFGVGLYTAMIDGKLYVSDINKDILQRRAGPREPQIGDEVLAVNGVPVEQIAAQRMMYTQQATYDSRLTMALESILMPYTSVFRPVKEGDDVRITLQRGQDKFDIHLNWINLYQYMIARRRFPRHFDSTRWKGSEEEAPTPFNWSGQVQSNFRRGLLKSGATIVDVGALLNAELEKKNSGGEQGPKGPTLKPVTRLQAYMVRHEGKNIGVLRIPSYSSDDMVNEIRWVAEAIKRLDSLVDVFVLDVLDNSGGSVYFGVRLVSMLAGDGALASIRANTRLTETLVHNFAPTGSRRDLDSGELANYGEQRLDDLEYLELKRKYDAGEKWTGWEPSFSNVRNRKGAGVVVGDSKVKFTKKLLILNSMRSASGGDFIPAILQSAKRGLIMGETSKGLGAPVYRSTESMPGSEMNFRCPMAECERVDGIPIENVGPVPDIPRPLVIEDVLDGFVGYSADILATAVSLANGKSRADLQGLVKERVGKRLHSERSKKNVAPAQALLDKFAESSVFTRATESDLAKVAPKLAAAYEVLGQKLALAGKDFSRQEWQMLVLPMPKKLIGRDHILSSLWRKDGMIERLEQLPEVPKWKNEPALLGLAQTLATVLKQIPGDLRVADNCNLLLLADEAKP